MFAQKRHFLCVGFLAVWFLFTGPASAQITASDGAYASLQVSTNQGSNPGLDLQAQGLHGSTANSGTGFKYNPLDATSSDAVHDVAVRDNLSGENSTSGAIKQKVTEIVADPNSVVVDLPPTFTVSTAALLELHAMRKSAVDLCIQLPTKYRTRLPECAEIFKNEIRLQGLAKKHN